MEDHADIDDPNDYPDPGRSTLNPYPALSQPAWGPYGKPPDVNRDASMDRDDSPAYPDLDASQTPDPYGASNEYTQLAEQFHMQYGSPQNRQNYHFPGASIEYETDVDAEHDERPMDNPFYDPELIRRADEARAGGDYVPSESDASDDDDPEFEDNFARALDAISEDERAIGEVTKPGRGRPRGRGRGTGRARGKGRGWKWALKGTEHDPKLQKDAERRRGRPSGPRTGPHAKKSKRRKRAEDPGPEFKKLQEQATGAFLSGELDTAMELARQAVMTNPEIYVAHSLLSDILIAKGNHKDALGALMTGANIKKDPDLWLLVANKTLEMAGSIRTRGEYDQAVFCLTKAIHYSHGEDNFELRTRRRDLHLDAGHDVKARIDTKTLLRARPDDLENLKLYAELCLESADASEIAAAREAYEQAFQLFADTDTFGDAEVQWAHLNMYLDLADRSKDPVYAISQLKRLARWFLGRKEDEYWDNVTDDDREYDSGHERRYEIPEFKNSSNRSTDFYGDGLPLDLRVKLGIFRLKLNDHDEGLRHFDHIYELKDDITNVYDLFYTIGDTLRLRAMFDQAIRFYQPIEVLEDELTDQFWISMAACHRGLKDFAEAENCYRAVMELDPNHASARAELAKMLADDMNEKEKAMVIIRDLIAMGRKDIIRKERLEMPPVNPRASARKEKLLEHKRKRGHVNLLAVPELDETLQRKRQKQRDNYRLREARKRANMQDGSGSDSDDEADESTIPSGLGLFNSSRTLFGENGEPLEGEELSAELEKQKQHREKAKQRRGFAEILKKEDDRDRFFEAQAERILKCFSKVKDLWHVLDDENANEEEVFEWMDNARLMYREFRTMRVFYPGRDLYKPFKGFAPVRIRNRHSKFIRELEAFKKRLEDNGVPQEAAAAESGSENGGEGNKKQAPPPLDISTPADFHGIPFSTWHHIFVDLALLDAKQSDQESCYEIIENGLFNANVFYHNEELLNTSQAASICCGLMFNDTERLTKTARWFATRGDLRAGSSYQLITAVSRLAYGDSTYFTAGPTQKFMLRSVKTLDYQALSPAMRRKYDFSMPASTLKRRTKPEFAKDGLDPGALMNYGHMVAVANHSSSALPYYFRAFALKPEDPSINLSIASQYVSGAMKRQTNNRHHEIHHGLSFLYRYYDLRTRDGVAAHLQEAEYNVGRMWHVLGLTYLAIPAYERAMALSEKVQMDIEIARANRKARLEEIERSQRYREEIGAAFSHDEEKEAAKLRDEEQHCLGLEDFATEAAFALQAIYIAVGNQRAAQKIAEKWLVL
jgi:general transcription factor 3C polypeptide 3 (transcription factor C subunit 4)